MHASMYIYVGHGDIRERSSASLTLGLLDGVGT